MADTYLSRTPSSQGDRRTYTISCWVKRHTLAFTNTLMDVFLNASQWYSIGWRTNDKFYIYHADSGTDYGYVTDMVFRDVSAWYHIVLAVDTTQASASNRVKLYVNGEQVTFNQDYGDFPQNESTWVNSTNAHHIGRYNDVVRYSEFTLAHYNFTDGTAYQASDFGETDTNGQWKPKTTPSVTYGTNGFFLKFANSGSLGTDSSGNGNDFTKNGSGDQVTDTPDNNFATWNSVGRQYGQSYVGTFSEGNTISASGGNATHNWGTIPITSTTNGWYWECKCTSLDAIRTYVGIIDPSGSTDNSNGASYDFLYKAILSSNGDFFDTADGQGGSSSASFTSYTVNDIIQIAYKNGSIWFGKNGTWMNSGDPSAGTGAVATDVDTTKTWIPYAGYNSTWSINFGNPSFAISSGNTDDNGYGNFEYAPPTGFLALCTKNLASELTLPIGDGSLYQNQVLYTGTGSARDVTGYGFQPDWVWIKQRSGTTYHRLYDSSRGAGQEVYSNATDAESDGSASQMSAFISDGFSIPTSGGNYTNINTATYVAWGWKVNGGTTSSNSDGSITTTLQSNATSGFAIATWSGTGTAGTIGHGLGVQPKLVIVKRRNSPANSWLVQHGDLASNFVTFLNRGDTGGETDSSVFNGTYPTSSVFSVGTHAGTNQSGGTYVGYIFAPITGYSAIGKYTGNGSTDGTFVYTGFRPAFVLIKRTDTAKNWYMFDTVRNTYNVVDNLIAPNLSDAEGVGTGTYLDILSNGFKLRQDFSHMNASGGSHIYMAFAEAPFKSGTGATTIEGTAR